MIVVGRHRFGWIDPEAVRLVYCGEIPICRTMTPFRRLTCPNCRKVVTMRKEGV